VTRLVEENSRRAERAALFARVGLKVTPPKPVEADAGRASDQGEEQAA